MPSLGAPFVVVHAHASEDETRRRIVRRTADPETVSDADWSVYLRAAQTFAPPEELKPTQLVQHASGEQTPEDAAREVEQTVIGDDHDQYDEVIAVWYPNRAAFLGLMDFPGYLEATEHRLAGLEQATLLAITPPPD